jgi:spore maturation protein CgeB
MAQHSLKVVVCGLSITSSWGNSHATTYRPLIRALSDGGHDVLFLERDMPRHAAHRDLPHPPFCRTGLYSSLQELHDSYTAELHGADLVIVGSHVPEGVEVGEWAIDSAGGVAAFYDLDTPVTLAMLAAGRCEYLSRRLIPRYHLYLSFAGGPALTRLEHHYGAQAARALYPSADPELCHPMGVGAQWDMGYLGTYNPGSQQELVDFFKIGRAHV